MRVDTIVASITGSPPAPVAWLRLSGPDAYSIAAQVFSPWPATPQPQRAVFGGFLHGDKGLALPFPEGQSYTGEETVELSLHGSTASVRTLLDACIVAGARQALPGEFTMRAFMNGKLDLAQAEAVAEMIGAETGRQFVEASRNREGALSRSVGKLRTGVIDLLASIEACVDFSEEIGDLDFDRVARTAGELAVETLTVIEEGRRVHLARSGIRVAILGQPNAGKSSLMNALLGYGRAIVSELPGTTRDTIEESLEIQGIRVALTDTAGLRDGLDEVEKLGIERTGRAAESADVVVYVYDSAVGWSEADTEYLARLARTTIVVGNKSDLKAPSEGIAVSALTRFGVDILADRLVSGLSLESSYPPVNDRQRGPIQLAYTSLCQCREGALSELPPDLLCLFLNEAAVQFGRVTGETATPEMLDEIFSRFCVGK